MLLLLSYFLLWSSSWQLRPNFLCDLSRRWLKPYCHPLMRYFTDTNKPIKECSSPENLQSIIDCSGRLTPPAHSVNDLDACPLAPVSFTGINSLLSMATPCVTQWGIPGHVGITSTGLNGSPFPVVKITCSNLLQVGEGEFDNNSPGKKLQPSRNKEQRKRRKKMSNTVSPVGPEF